MRNRTLQIIAIVAAIAVALALIYSYYRPQRISYRLHPDKNSLRIGVDIFPGHAPIYLGVATGIFERHGLRVTPIVLRSTAERRAALLRGDIDGICATINELTIAWTQGARAVVVAGIDESYGGDGVVAKRAVTSVEDLRGRKIALETGSPSHFFLIYLLSKHGLSLADVEVVNIEAANVGAAFMSGSVDAAVTWDPWLHQIADNPDAEAHILSSTREHPAVIADVLAVRPELIMQSPDAVKRLIEAWLDTIDYVNANPAESNRIMASWMKVDVKDFRGMLAGIRFADREYTRALFGTAEEPGALYSLIEVSSDLWLESQNVDFAIEPEQILDPSFVRRLQSQAQ